MWLVRIGPGAGRRSDGGSAEVWKSVAGGAVRRLKGEFTATAAAAAAAASGLGSIRGATGFAASFENTSLTWKRRENITKNVTCWNHKHWRLIFMIKISNILDYIAKGNINQSS